MRSFVWGYRWARGYLRVPAARTAQGDCNPSDGEPGSVRANGGARWLLLDDNSPVMNPYAYGVNNPLAHPDSGGMLIANFDDPLVPCGGDSPHNARASKRSPYSGGPPTEPLEPCSGDPPGMNSLNRLPYGFEIYMDDCVTGWVILTLGGAATLSGLAIALQTISKGIDDAGADTTARCRPP